MTLWEIDGKLGRAHGYDDDELSPSGEAIDWLVWLKSNDGLNALLRLSGEGVNRSRAEAIVSDCLIGLNARSGIV